MRSNDHINYNQKIIMESIQSFSKELGVKVFGGEGVCDKLSGMFLLENIDDFYNIFDYLYKYKNLPEHNKESQKQTPQYKKAAKFIRALSSSHLNTQTPFKLLGAYWLTSTLLTTNNLTSLVNKIHNLIGDIPDDSSRLFRIDFGIIHSVALKCIKEGNETKYLLYDPEYSKKSPEFTSIEELSHEIYKRSLPFRGDDEALALNIHEILFEMTNEYKEKNKIINEIYYSLMAVKDKRPFSKVEFNLELLLDEYIRGKVSQSIAISNMRYLLVNNQTLLSDLGSEFSLLQDDYTEANSELLNNASSTYFKNFPHNGNIRLLHLACYNGDLSLLKCLLSTPGIDVNQALSSTSSYGIKDPISIAIIKGHSLSVELLIGHHADFLRKILVPDFIALEMTFLHVAAQLNDYDTFKVLFPHFKFEMPLNQRLQSPLTMAINEGNLLFIKQVLNDFSDKIHVRLNEVVFSMERDNFPCAEYLLDKFINDLIAEKFNGNKSKFDQAITEAITNPQKNRITYNLYMTMNQLFKCAKSLPMFQMLCEKYKFSSDEVLSPYNFRINDKPEIVEYLNKNMRQKSAIEQVDSHLQEKFFTQQGSGTTDTTNKASDNLKPK
jgi:hypothetical protein